MIDTATASDSVEAVETALRTGLASGDSSAANAVPVLRHLLSSEDATPIGEDTLARVRGMLRNYAVQLLTWPTPGEESPVAVEPDNERVSQLSDLLIENPAFVGHLHSLALEWQLTERLQVRLGIDPVLTPFLQALIASENADTSAIAMRYLTSQARHCQAQRRMNHSLLELPGDLLHAGLMVLRTSSGDDTATDSCAAIVEASIRSAYNEASTRLGLISRLVISIGSGAVAALSVSNAGVSIFLTALSIGAGIDRDMAVMSTSEAQIARFALSLRSAGLSADSVQEQCFNLHPDKALPDGFDQIGADRAAAILAATGGFSGV